MKNKSQIKLSKDELILLIQATEKLMTEKFNEKNSGEVIRISDLNKKLNQHYDWRYGNDYKGINGPDGRGKTKIKKE